MSVSSPAQLPAEVLRHLPIFPLPDVVFFPGTLLPLHVFEPRYRQLVTDILTEPLPALAVVRLRPGWESEYYGNPPVFDVAGAGVIVHHERLEDGRYNILVHGVERVKLVTPMQQTPYRRMRAEILADRYPPATDLGVGTTTLLACCQKLGALMPEIPRALRELGKSGLEPGQVADVIGSTLVRDPDERQKLLETSDVGERLSQVTAVAAAMVAQLAKSRPAN